MSSTAPNTSPAFIQTMGIVGYPANLTTQVVTSPDVPGTTPVVIYDPTQTYSLGNGALVECIKCQLTNTTAQTAVLLYYKLLEDSNPVWRLASQIPIAAFTYSTTAQLPAYFMPLPNILTPSPAAGNAGTTANPLQFQGLRINGSNNRSVQWGAALTVAAGNAPIIVTMHGGEY